MNKSTIIFDLDGVIVDTAKYHFLAWKKLANSLGIDFSAEQNEQLKGVSRIDSLKKILAWGNKSVSKATFDLLIDETNKDYLNHVNRMDESEILEGLKEILDFLKKRNHLIALGSASKNSKSILKKVNLLHRFNAIVDGNDTTKGKPDPQVFTLAARMLSVKPESCIVFEDAIAGIQAANAAKMTSIGIGCKEVLHEADFVFLESESLR